MTEQAQRVLEGIIRDMPRDQPFTIGELVRQHIQQAAGMEWQGIWEVATWDDMESYLLERNLINEYGAAKLYTTTQEAKKL